MKVNKNGVLNARIIGRTEAYKLNASIGQQISKNYKRGETVRDIQIIEREAFANRAIYHSGIGIKPAAIFYHWSFAQLRASCNNGYFSLIVKM